MVMDMTDDVKEIKQELRIISDTLIRNTASLEIHVARTDLAEKRLDHIENFNKWWLGLMASAVVAVALRLLLK
jgi:hypothetical protein